MRRIIGFILLIFILTSAQAQVLSLDSARALALRNNKELAISRLKQDVARYNRQSARTNYLPKVEAIGGYLYSSKELSLLSDAQKGMFGNLGTIAGQQMMEALPGAVTTMVQSGLITMQQAQAITQIAAQAGPAFQQALNGVGQSLTDAFRTDTRHMWGGSIMVTQPIFMGGKISTGI